MTEQEFGLAAIDDIIRDSVTGREHHSVRWESFTGQFIEAIKTAKVYVDCGAEYGFYIRLALKYGTKDLRIFAFEPEPIRFQLLSRMLENEPNVMIYTYAVAKECSRRRLFKPAVGFSASFFQSGDPIETATVAVDDMLPDVKVDVIKMDVEGAEDFAFSGMTRILHGKPKLFVEWHPPVDDSLRTATVGLLHDAGYEIVLEGSQCGRVVLG